MIDPGVMAAVLGVFFALLLSLIRWGQRNTGLETDVATYARQLSTVKDALGYKTEELRIVLNNISDGVLIADIEGNIRSANPAALRIFGHSENTLLNGNLNSLLQPDPRHNDGKEVSWRAVTENDTPDVDKFIAFNGVRRNGSLVPLDLGIQSHGMRGERLLSVIIRDLTERTDAEHALHERQERLREAMRQIEEVQNHLLQSEKMASVGQLAAGVAHEINNPIGFVNSNLGSLKRGVGDLLEVIGAYSAADALLAAHPTIMASIAEAKNAADFDYLREDLPTLIDESLEGLQRVKKIVQDLKDFSRVDVTDWEFVNIEDGLESTLNIVWNELKYKAALNKEYAELPLIECIPARLNQVFMNLLVNAAQAIHDRGTITVRTGCNDNEIWVEVEDNGRGIAPENLERIFEPFFTTKPVGQGTGLGLSLVHSIVTSHEGHISVRSEIGVGSCFRVYLPILRAEPSESPRPSALFTTNAPGDP